MSDSYVDPIKYGKRNLLISITVHNNGQYTDYAYADLRNTIALFMTSVDARIMVTPLDYKHPADPILAVFEIPTSLQHVVKYFVENEVDEEGSTSVQINQIPELTD